MNLHPALAIFNETQLSEPIHEETDPRPGCAHHLRKGLLTVIGVEAVHAQQTFHVLLRHLYEFDTGKRQSKHMIDRWSPQPA